MKLDVKDLYDGIKDYMDKEVTLQGRSSWLVMASP